MLPRKKIGLFGVYLVSTFLFLDSLPPSQSHTCQVETNITPSDELHTSIPNIHRVMVTGCHEQKENVGRKNLEKIKRIIRMDPCLFQKQYSPTYS